MVGPGSFVGTLAGRKKMYGTVPTNSQYPFFLDKSSSGVIRRLYAENLFPGYPQSGCNDYDCKTVNSPIACNGYDC